MKILVVDDHPLIVEDIKDELRGIAPEAECVGTCDPTEVMELFEKWRFDVAFLDIDMPMINGLTLAKRILEKYPHTNIIYVTGHEQYALESYKTYASDFITKPVSTARLKNAMRHLRHPVSKISEEDIITHYSGKNPIGKRITKYREERNLSRNEFSRLMNVSVQSVYRWESGDRIPDVVTMLEIAKVLNVTMDQLMGLK